MLIAKSLKHYFCEILQYSRKLSQEKTFANWWKVRFFAEKTFTDHSLVPPNKAMPPNFTDKTFVNGHKPRNSQKFFSLEGFQLFCIYYARAMWTFKAAQKNGRANSHASYIHCSLTLSVQVGNLSQVLQNPEHV